MKRKIKDYNKDIEQFEQRNTKLGKQVTTIKTKFENQLTAAQDKVRQELLGEEDGLF